MVNNLVYTTLIIIALLAILRSEIIDCLILSRFKEWLIKKGYFLLHDGINCDECVGFWLVVAILFNHPILILPTYGLLIIYLRLTSTAQVSE
jgi:uncharacterized MnhB-related membrane protein